MRRVLLMPLAAILALSLAIVGCANNGPASQDPGKAAQGSVDSKRKTEDTARDASDSTIVYDGTVNEVKGAEAGVDESQVRGQYEKLTRLLIERGVHITTMESCTSGLIASLVTDTEGSSAVIKGAFVTYSNEAKVMQGVPAQVIEKYGVYSAQTAAAMAKTCRTTYSANIGVGVTGSFGNPDPNNTDSVPGEVYFALATDDGVDCYHCEIPEQASRSAYKMYMADVIVKPLLQYLQAKS